MLFLLELKKPSMPASYRTLLINTILICLIIQINGGYWVCDWVNGRGWMYCSRGTCNTFLGKRSISTDDQQTGPLQNNDGTYCLNKKFCYACQPIDEDTCRITLQTRDFPTRKSYLRKKQADEDICS
jgi:hypothetical protein